MSGVPNLTKTEWKDFQQYILLSLIQNPNINVGQWFVWDFPDVAYAMAENSNLGTPADVHHPNDDVILSGIKNANDAFSFILDRVDIVDDPK